MYDIKAQSEQLKKFYLKSETDMSVEKRKTLMKPKQEEVDKAVYEWFALKRSEGACISGPMLMEKAKYFHEKMGVESHCGYTNGWLEKFKIRHGVRKLDVSGEKKSADETVASDFRDYFARTVAKYKLTPEQIYNADETGAFYRCLPKTTLALAHENSAAGYKANKERMTLLLCANAAGTHKVRLLAIGKFAKPHCLRGILHLPVDYKNQKSSWMDSDIFTWWFHHAFVPSVKEHLRKTGKPEDSTIVLFLDNCRAHPPANKLRSGNIFVIYLPPNVTSIIQPMDQGVIQNVKMLYRRDFMRRLVNYEGTIPEFQKTINIKEAIYMLSFAWDSVKSTTLQRCWRKLWPQVMDVDSDVPDFEGFPAPPLNEADKVYNQIRELVATAKNLEKMDENVVDEWLAVDENIPVAMSMDDDEIIAAIKEDNPQATSTSESESEDETVKVSWEEGLNGLQTFINFAQHHSFASLQDIMHLMRLQNKALHERRKSLKQTDVRTLFARAAQRQQQSRKEPLPGPSTTPEPVPGPSITPEPVPSDNPDDPDDQDLELSGMTTQT